MSDTHIVDIVTPVEASVVVALDDAAGGRWPAAWSAACCSQPRDLVRHAARHLGQSSRAWADRQDHRGGARRRQHRIPGAQRAISSAC